MATKKPQGMMRTFRYPLHPTKAQAEVLESWRIACQQLYNGALQERRDAWNRCGIKITLYMQHKSLIELRRDTEWLDIPSDVERSALARVDRAFEAFFRRCKAGEKTGYPRFRSRDRYDSFGLGPYVPMRKNSVRIPKLGWTRFHEYRPLKGLVKNVVVKKDCGKWFVLFQCDLGEAPAKVVVSSAIGIDLGLTHFATLSNGEQVENPRLSLQSRATLAKRQRVLCRKDLGSNRRKPASLAVAKVHRHIKNQRVDFARKLACRLYERFDLIAHEDLNIRGMVQSPLGKSINDAAWGTFIYALTLKAESAGRWCVPVNPRGTSQRCSSCGATVSKTLAERTHMCGCGLVLDRDHNAALNVLALAALPEALGEVTLVDRDSPVGNEKPSFG